MRELTSRETDVVRWFAALVDEPQRQSILDDLAKATAEELWEEQLTIRFQIEGYVRPPYQFERPLPVDATVTDADGTKLAVTLAMDENSRLFELQVLRFEPGPVRGPDWNTLRLLPPHELVHLGTLRLNEQRKKA